MRRVRQTDDGSFSQSLITCSSVRTIVHIGPKDAELSELAIRANSPIPAKNHRFMHSVLVRLSKKRN